MKIGVIGGSGLEKSDLLENIEELIVETPYGKPSSIIKKGVFNGTEIFILSRHGLNHEIPPSKVNNRANIAALKKLGCKYVLATTAVGSLRTKLEPGDFLIANQFIDFTKHREVTFYDNFKDGITHTSLADPFSSKLRDLLIESCEELNLKHHKIGTILTIEGPRFSTRAESFMFRNFAHAINMSTSPEAILAKEAGLEYATVAMITDYDCWKKTEIPVTWEQIKSIMEKNSQNVKRLLIRTLEKITQEKITNKTLEIIKNNIRTIPNWPKEEVMYRDITTLINNPNAMNLVINELVSRYKDKGVEVIVGIESRGFIFGSILAKELGVGFVPIRKKGKLPSETEAQEYSLEYGIDSIEIHKDSIKQGQKVLLIDDLLATGGTALAACQLIKRLGGKIVECAFIINLPDIGGSQKLEQAGYKVFKIVEFEGE